jgi:hypothetical protein
LAFVRFPFLNEPAQPGTPVYGLRVLASGEIKAVEAIPDNFAHLTGFKIGRWL